MTHSDDVEAFAAYLNAPRGFLPVEEQVLFDADLDRARAAMERSWLESTPVRKQRWWRRFRAR